MAQTDILWGGTLTAIELDPVEWKLSATVEVTGGSAFTRYTLVLEELRSLRIDRVIPLPWDRAELTEVHMSESAEGVRVEFVIWDDNTALLATCSNLSMSEAV